ncbi:UTP--glucose-1-phosphate uridylyltransferase [Nosocomiicoccus ampullae]|uniref:UTP--glucose-1-phosphate uridylyltransferase n=1 Tax=Nosocomiicoccus ampullae TaxID=489910 RepID=UPI001C6025E4|nr:UTP--glucose-1-phosphate uridylyltransferase [Nosocomiicoccus ampullae]QYA48668.1 UTP--glucose-1-phosphate uridylyltransferase [Nosocomiicoccus ampullae]
MKEWILQYDLLSDDSKRKLDEQLKTLDLNEIESVYDDVYVNKQAFDTSNVTEVPYVTKDELNVEALKSLANSSINDGKVAVLLMAGGQGTRLGYDGPKGTFKFDDVSLFELQARQISKYNNVHWYIMTSDINHDETLKFFEENNYFNLKRENIHFFKQEHFPSLSKDGKLLLTKNEEVMITPNGNGGIFNALKTSGMLDDMKSRGIEAVFMNNVDNVVVKVLDEILVGLHLKEDNEVTSKSITPKENESVGRLALVDGKKGVIEYTEIPEGEDSSFKNANIGIHVFSVDFLERAANTKMPYHLALKNLEFLDGNLNLVKEEALKFEKFYFDVFYIAEKHNTLQVDRAGEFSPLKNREGQDSVETARRDLESINLI